MKRFLKDCGIIAVGSMFIAFALNSFLVPYQLSSGGIGSVGVILFYFLKVPLSVSNLVLNLILFALGIKFLDKQSILKSVVGIVLLTFFLQVSTYFPFFKEDILFACVIGGVLDGAGMGLVLKVNASTGGIDFCCLMVKKKFPHISIAGFIFTVNACLFIISGICFKSYMVVFYSVVAMFISAKVTDAVLNIGEAAKSIQIISEHHQEIEAAILQDIDRGVTEIHAEGGYTKDEKKMLFCVVKPKEAPKIVRLVKEIDNSAFIIISDAREVLGNGFKSV